MTAKSACSAGASGVVSLLAVGCPAMMVPLVPTRAEITRAALSPASIKAVTVVFPVVPVTPIVVIAEAGAP
jgi:hypothetical protein